MTSGRVLRLRQPRCPGSNRLGSGHGVTSSSRRRPRRRAPRRADPEPDPRGKPASANREGRPGPRVEDPVPGAHGARRDAYIALPAWYGPRNNPRIPLVISPHGRGLTARANTRRWGWLPAQGCSPSSPRPGAAAGSRSTRGAHKGRSTTSPGCRRFSDARCRGFASTASASLHSAEAWAARRCSSCSRATRTCSPESQRSTPSPTSRASTAVFRVSPAGARAHVSGMGRSASVFSHSHVRRSAGRPESARSAMCSAARSPTHVRSPASCVPLQLWWSTNDRIVADPGAAVGQALSRDSRAQPTSAGPGVRRRLGALGRDAGHDPIAGGGCGVWANTIRLPENALRRPGAGRPRRHLWRPDDLLPAKHLVRLTRLP